MDKELQLLVAKFIESTGKDGPSLSLLDALTESEKAEVIGWLVEQINPRNIHAIRALSYLKARPAIPKLKRIFSSAGGRGNVYLCQALWNIDKFEPALAELCRIAVKDSVFGQAPGREVAISMLGGIKEDLSEHALAKLLFHKQAHIRLLAVRSLASLLGMTGEARRLDESVSMPFASRQRTLDEVSSVVADALKRRREPLAPT